MAKTRQFQTSAEKRSFFDRKVSPYGYSRMVALGKVMPKEWTYVRIRKIAETDRVLTITIERLRGKKDDTLVTKDNKTDRWDT